MKALKEAYESFGESDDIYAKSAYGAEVNEMLDEFVKAAGDTRFTDMTLEQLKAVDSFFTVLLTRVNQANRTFSESYDATVSDMATLSMNEMRSAAKLPFFLKPKTVASKASATVRRFLINNMKPAHFFELTGSSTLIQLGEGLHRGELIWGQDVAAAKAFFDEAAKNTMLSPGT